MPDCKPALGRIEMRRAVGHSGTHSQEDLTVIFRYALAVGSVALALALGLLLRHYDLNAAELPLFLFAVGITAWHGGMRPAVLSIALSSLAFDYFFAFPLYSLVITFADVPRFVILISFGALITRFNTVRRSAEEELRQARDELQAEVIVRSQQASLLDLTHDTIFVRDASDSITYWNRGAQELYGWTAEQVVGKRSHELLKTVFPVALDDIHTELLRTQRWEGELEHTKADGSTVAVASRWSLRRDEDGNPAAILETNNDISNQKRREEEIRSLNAELESWSTELQAANRELEAFAYSVSHDLRAPLRHMIGFAELLQKRSSSILDDKGRRYLTMILESAQGMGNLIDDLLTFSRIGRAETQMTGVNLDQLVKEVLGDLRQEIDGREISWKIGTLPDCHGDRSMLKLVLANLVSNAIKFTSQRTLAEIEIGSAKGREQEVVVFVKDNGAGFDMKYVSKLFGVFQRLHHTDEFDGTGIGLATIQRIVHRHGGLVHAEGAVDQGATFYFSVPKS
jgi:PAS domain S-box-containing protein